MSFKHYVIRNQLYEEEFRPAGKIPQQVCVMLEQDYPPMDFYATHIENGYLVQDEIMSKQVVTQHTLYLIVYVQSEKLALLLAQRYCDEEEQKRKNTKVLGIDRYYSVFD